MSKVVKFGGSSLADANQFRKVADIIRSDKERRYVVPSAPGKRFKDDIKVTDMLYACYDAVANEGKNAYNQFAPIAERFNGIISDLGLTLSLDDEYEVIIDNFRKKAGKDYAASRGEYLNGIILANYLGYEFVDAAKVVCVHLIAQIGEIKFQSCFNCFASSVLWIEVQKINNSI
jgi:aspartate kinase